MVTFIWDLDGTLLNSYDVIVSGLYNVCKEFGYKGNIEEIRIEAIKHSVSYFIDKIVKEKGLPFEKIKERYSKITEENNDKITLMKNAKEVLEGLKEKNIDSFILTHRGLSTDFVLNNVGISSYFKEVITSKSGFKRKPDPEGINYLIEKYNLDRNNTYYVGDRVLDIECANNANIKSILYLPKESFTIPTLKETYIVSDLIDILKLI